MPRLSVTLCNYNHGIYLEQCFAGILRQSFTDFELIVTDDGSTDGSQEIIARIAKHDKRISVNYFKQNQGAMAAMDDTWKRVQGDLVFGMGADDFIGDPRFFEMAVKGLALFKEASGFSAVAGLYSAERKEFVGAIGQAPHEGYIPPLEFYPNFLKGKIFITGTSIWRVDLLKAFGGYDFSFGPQTDFFINHALPSIHGVVFCRTAVTGQRVYEKKSNYGSRVSLWDAASRFQRIEERMRKIGTPYPEMEADWIYWRSKYMKDIIQSIG